MKAWAESLPGAKDSKIRFLGDPSGAFARAFDTEFDSAAVFGSNRSKRYAVVTENGAVKDAYVEPDNTGVNGESFFFLKSSILFPLLSRLNYNVLTSFCFRRLSLFFPPLDAFLSILLFSHCFVFTPQRRELTQSTSLRCREGSRIEDSRI